MKPGFARQTLEITTTVAVGRIQASDFKVTRMYTGSMPMNF